MTKTLLTLATMVLSGAALASDFTLSSPHIKTNATLKLAQVFNGFGCTGGNQSPALSWTAGPPGTKSYALTVYDPDAPSGSGWWHWVVYNLPAQVTSLPPGAGESQGKGLPAGARQGRTDFGTVGYGGACPPPGERAHHYQFTLYALKQEKLDVPETATAALIGYMIHTQTLAKAQLVARYGR